ncbi:MAG TPA: hypothetical protein VKP11_07500, partial [Frankiaceae bacterium]|nr:hypothetical protein [Frankiaceae bacterium]
MAGLGPTAAPAAAARPGAGPGPAAPPCAACGADRMRVFHTQLGVPVNSCLLVDTAAEALAFPRSD